MTSFQTLVREEARLIILRALSAEVGMTLNSSLLTACLESYGIAKTREWVHGELQMLEESGAVSLTRQGSVVVASLTRRGLDHVERRLAIEGVKRPSPAEV